MRCGRLFLIPSVAITGTSLSGYFTHEGVGSTTVSRRHLHSNTMQEEGAVNRDARTSSTGAAIPSSTSASATAPTDGTPDFIQSLLSRRRLLDRPIYEHFCSIFASSSSSPLTSSSASSSSTSFLSHPSVSLAVICTEELEKVENICSLHLTQQSQWDRLLVSNTAMQERLAQLSSWRCGLQSLLSYVSHHLAEQPSASSCASPEVAALHILAEMAMLESASLVREMVDASLWPTAVPHLSCLPTDNVVQEERETTATTEKKKEEEESATAAASSTPIASSVPKGTPGKCIDYPYIEEFLEVRIPSLFLQPHTRTVPSIIEQVYTHILPLLSVSSRSAGTTRGGIPLLPSWLSASKGMAEKSGADSGQTSPTSSLWSFSSTPQGGGRGSLLSRMMGMQSGGDGGFRLHAPHLLLQHTAEGIEQQTVSFLKWIDLQNASKPLFSSSTDALEKGMGQKMPSSGVAREVLWGSRLGMGLADIFASVAILHRGSAALAQLETQEATAATPSTSSERCGRSDGEGKGEQSLATATSGNVFTASHLDSLYAQSFPFFSNQRVSRYMHEVNMADAMLQRMNTTAKRSSTSSSSAKRPDADESPIFLSIDGSATHPIVLASFEKK